MELVPHRIGLRRPAAQAPHDTAGGLATPGLPATPPTTDVQSRGAWWPLALRAGACGVGALLLAAVGAWSLSRVPASALAQGAAPLALTADVGTTFMAPAAHAVAAPSTQTRLPGHHTASAAPRDADPRHDGGSAPPRGVTDDGKVILNTAGVDDLVRLPGVGKRRAEAIVALRQRLRRFKRVHDLLRVRGIGPRSLRRMMPHLVLDPPQKDPAPENPPQRDPPRG